MLRERNESCVVKRWERVQDMVVMKGMDFFQETIVIGRKVKGGGAFEEAVNLSTPSDFCLSRRQREEFGAVKKENSPPCSVQATLSVQYMWDTANHCKIDHWT